MSQNDPRDDERDDTDAAEQNAPDDTRDDADATAGDTDAQRDAQGQTQTPQERDAQNTGGSGAEPPAGQTEQTTERGTGANAQTPEGEQAPAQTDAGVATQTPDQTQTQGQTQTAQSGGGDSRGGADFDIEDTKQDTGVQEVRVRGYGRAFARKLTFGTMEKYERQSRGGGGAGAGLTPSNIAEIFNEHYEDPDFSSANGGQGLTGDDVADMPPTTPGFLLDAIADEGMDIEMNPDGSAQIDTSGNSAGR